MTTTLWGRTSSINVRKVMLALNEVQLPHERIDAGMHHGVVTGAEFMRKNPNAMIPLLEDGGVVLWESNVIVRYLCESYSADLYPADRATRYEAEKWMDWQQTTLNQASRPGFVQLIRLPPEQRDDAVVERSWQETHKCFGILEALFASRPFAAGDRYSMADIPLALEMQRWLGVPWRRTFRPHLQGWWERVLARPAAKGVLDLPLA
jgi:glutathione S-transferase